MFFVYGKETCPYCHEAVREIKKHGYEVIYLDVGEHPEWRDPEWETVPQIFHSDIYLGGYNDLVQYLETL